MKLPSNSFDHWLAGHEFAAVPPRFDLAASTGPTWTLGELRALDPDADPIDDTAIGYTSREGSTQLRSAIAEYAGVDPDWVVVTTGASEAYSLLCCVLCYDGATAALPSPAYPTFAAMAAAWRLEARYYQLRPEDSFVQTADRVLNAVDATTVFALVNTPHMPTGSVMRCSEIELLAQSLSEKGVPLIVDAVFHPLYYREMQPCAANIPNVVTIGDMSKALSLPGLRIGWIIDPDAERRQSMIDARAYFSVCSSPICEALAAHAIRQRQAILDRLRKVAEGNLADLKSFMKAHADTLSWIEPVGGTTCFPWFNDRRNSWPFCSDLVEQGVLLVPGDCFSMPSHMRLGFAAQEKGFSQALEIIASRLERC